MNTVLVNLLEVLYVGLRFFMWVIFASAIMSWLYAFNIISRSNSALALVSNMLERITEPVLRPIRRVLPDLGGVDVSPIIAFLIIMFLSGLVGDFALQLRLGA